MKRFIITVLLLITVFANLTAVAADTEVLGIKISVNKNVMLVGETQRITVTVFPSDTDIQLEYISSAPEIVIAGIGSLIAQKTGTATITVKVKDTEIQDSLNITVVNENDPDGDKTDTDEKEDTIKVSEITVGSKSIYLDRYETKRLTFTVLPDNAENKSVTFRSSNTSVATVDDRGYVYAKRAGNSTITIESNDGNASVTVKVYVTDEDEDDTRNDSTLRSINITYDDEVVKDKFEVMEKTTVQLSIKSSPSSASKKVTWRSSNKKIATVDSSGKVTGVKKGTCTLYATSAVNSSKRDSITVVVTDYIRYPDSIKITSPDDAVFKTGSAVQLTAEILPADTTERNLIWRVYGGATISQTGMLKITDAGEITVKAYSTNYKTVGEYKLNAEYSENHFLFFGGAYNLTNSKSIELYFDSDVNAASAISGIFACENVIGNGEHINVTVKTDGKKITVRPTAIWPEGDVYLFIKGSLCDTQGDRLGKNLKYKMNIRRNVYDKES